MASVVGNAPQAGADQARVGGVRASLTLQEREVARLAATGMTNREIAARLYVAPGDAAP